MKIIIRPKITEEFFGFINTARNVMGMTIYLI